MADHNGNGNGRSLSGQINANTSMAIGMVLVILGAVATGAYQASKTILQLEWMSTRLEKLEARTEELIKRVDAARKVP